MSENQGFNVVTFGDSSEKDRRKQLAAPARHAHVRGAARRGQSDGQLLGVPRPERAVLEVDPREVERRPGELGQRGAGQ